MLYAQLSLDSYYYYSSLTHSLFEESQREQQKHVESLRSEVQAARKREKLLEKSVQELQQFIEHFRQQQGKIWIFQLFFLKSTTESAQEERERVHHAQISRAERESTALRGEIKQIRQRMEAAQGAAQKLMHLEAELAERYFLIIKSRFGKFIVLVINVLAGCAPWSTKKVFTSFLIV